VAAVALAKTKSTSLGSKHGVGRQLLVREKVFESGVESKGRHLAARDTKTDGILFPSSRRCGRPVAWLCTWSWRLMVVVLVILAVMDVVVVIPFWSASWSWRRHQ